MDINALERPSRIRAEFFFDEDLNRELCKISIVGDSNSLLKKVTPEIINRFPKEFELYKKQSGQKSDEPVGGTPLREIPGVDRDAATVLRYHAIRNAEEFVAIGEQAARDLPGGNFLQFWRSAKNLLDAREAEQLRALLAEKTDPPKRGPGRPRKEPEAADLEPEADAL